MRASGLAAPDRRGAARAFRELAARQADRIRVPLIHGVRDGGQTQRSPIDAFHAEVEQWIKPSGLQWTRLRSSGLAKNAFRSTPQLRAGSVVREPYGAAGSYLIHERDIAAVAARALTSDGPSGATHMLTGPQALSRSSS